MFPFEIDEESDIPLWIQLRNRLVYLINSGYYRPGDQLPTVRGLASDMSINYNTVNKAYTSLAHDGYITSTRGRGAFVNALELDEDDDRMKAVDAALDDCIAACRDLGLTPTDVEKAMIRKIRKMEQKRSFESDGESGAGSGDASSTPRRGEMKLIRVMNEGDVHVRTENRG